MGLFGGKTACAVCGEKESKHLCTEIADGTLCPQCARYCSQSPLASVAVVRQTREENHRRFQQFHETKVLTQTLGGSIFVDLDHRLCYLSGQKKPKVEPLVFQFSEVEGYQLERVGEKTVTKTKGGLTRAVVGGALFGPAGAIVGASTAKTETKTTGGISILSVALNLGGLKTRVQLAGQPAPGRRGTPGLHDGAGRGRVTENRSPCNAEQGPGVKREGRGQIALEQSLAFGLPIRK